MYCEKCGLQISKGDKFCQQCGNKIVTSQLHNQPKSNPDTTSQQEKIVEQKYKNKIIKNKIDNKPKTDLEGNNQKTDKSNQYKKTTRKKYVYIIIMLVLSFLLNSLGGELTIISILVGPIMSILISYPIYYILYIIINRRFTVKDKHTFQLRVFQTATILISIILFSTIMAAYNATK